VKKLNFTFDEFVSFLSERYGVPREEIISDDSFGKIGLDSLSLFSLIEDIEQKFSVKVETEDITEIDTVRKMYDYICQAGESKE
jgi:acyl carrier protein